MYSSPGILETLAITIVLRDTPETQINLTMPILETRDRRFNTFYLKITNS